MAVSAEFDLKVRVAAMKFLADQRPLYPYGFPRDLLMHKFFLGGEKIPLISAAQGIHKPRVLDLPISIFTTYTEAGAVRPYDDEYDKDEFLLYKYRGTDPRHPNNVGLRKLMEAELPLIYIKGLKPSLYQASWPSRIVGDDPQTHTFKVEVVESGILGDAHGKGATADAILRRYARVMTKRRLHQETFRIHVLEAYTERCTVCRFAHADMLDAAHIIPDSDPAGMAAVPNGLSLCKLHHAAYDRNILGISPDYKIKIRKDVMDEEDGPTLKHGVQEFNGTELRVLPKIKALRPSADNLKVRYEKFLKF